MSEADVPGDVLFLFAHQDDEIGIATRIAYEARCGNRVWCAYLTDGALSVPATVRDAESLGVLQRLRVPRDRIAFLADGAGRIADGTLANELGRARAMLGAWIAASGARFARIFTMDWEGGHHDHDAAHLIALAVARDAGIPAVYAFALYNAYRRRRGFFRVTSFVPADVPVERRRIPLREAFEVVLRIAAYRSQRRTWIGLGPGFVARALLRREERFRLADPRRVARRPHDGALLYETLFGRDANDVLNATSSVRAELCADP